MVKIWLALLLGVSSASRENASAAAGISPYFEAAIDALPWPHDAGGVARSPIALVYTGQQCRNIPNNESLAHAEMFHTRIWANNLEMLVKPWEAAGIAVHIFGWFEPRNLTAHDRECHRGLLSLRRDPRWRDVVISNEGIPASARTGEAKGNHRRIAAMRRWLDRPEAAAYPFVMIMRVDLIFKIPIDRWRLSLTEPMRAMHDEGNCVRCCGSAARPFPCGSVAHLSDSWWMFNAAGLREILSHNFFILSRNNVYPDDTTDKLPAGWTLYKKDVHFVVDPVCTHNTRSHEW